MNTGYRLGELWQQTFINSPIAIAVISTKGKFAMVNRSLCDLLGYTEDELTKYQWQDLTHPEDILGESKLIFDTVTGELSQYKIKKRFIKKDGSEITVILLVSAIRNPNNKLQYLLSQALDITEITRLRAVAKLKLTPELKTEIKLALQHDELYLEYEPIYSLKDNAIAGHEGLIRWQHPQRGLIPPLDWIPACEEDADLMARVCSFVVTQGVIEAKRRNGWVSVNVSPVSLRSPMFFELLSDIAIVGDRPKVFLEITERVPFDPTCLERLQILGYGVLLDDFGQGHSSLIQLLEMLDRLEASHFKIKIDGWFTQSLGDRATQLVMCEFIDILHRLGVGVVAECIETEAQLKLWQELGVDYGQGWLWR